MGEGQARKRLLRGCLEKVLISLLMFGCKQTAIIKIATIIINKNCFRRPSSIFYLKQNVVKPVFAKKLPGIFFIASGLGCVVANITK